MTDCKDCKSNDICEIEKPCDGKGNCFFFSETEESRIRNSMEYKQGRADQKKEDVEKFLLKDCELCSAKIVSNAIENFINKFIKRTGTANMELRKSECIDIMRVIAEQIKEQKNE